MCELTILCNYISYLSFISSSVDQSPDSRKGQTFDEIRERNRRQQMKQNFPRELDRDKTSNDERDWRDSSKQQSQNINGKNVYFIYNLSIIIILILSARETKVCTS